MKPIYALLALSLAAYAATNAQTVRAETRAEARYETLPPAITEHMPQPAILVFSKTKGWRHNEGIAGADRYFAELTSEQGLGLFTTENGAVFNEKQLARFDLVVFNNMTGDALSPDQEQAFQKWLEDGGALIALHGSGDNSHGDWEWYDTQVIGPQFIGHPAAPQFQDARVVNLASGHPIMRGIPADWVHNDEWYSFDSADVGDATPLLGLDESTYSPQNLRYGDREDLRMGGGPEGHPVAWARCLGKGRAFYSALGHKHNSYDDPVYRQILINAVAWARDAQSCSSD